MKKVGFLGFLVCLVTFMIFLVHSEALAGKGNPIKVAILGPMTHVSGTYILNGASMAADEINQAGGVKVGGVKRPLELLKVDTNELQSVTDAASAVERAITIDKVDFLMGSWRSEAVLAEQDVAMDYKKVMITEGAHPSISERVKKDYGRYKYWFRAYQNSRDGAELYFVALPMFVKMVQEELKIPKPRVGVMMDKALWTDPMAAISKGLIEQWGGEHIGLWRPSMTATDMSAELLAAKNKDAHIIFVINWGPSGLVLAKQWDEHKIPAVLCGGIGEATYSTFWESSRGLGNYLSTVNFISRVKINETTIPFWDKYTEKYKAWPDVFSGHFYANMYRLKGAIENAGSLEPDAVVAALEKLVYVGPAGTYVSKGLDTDTPHDVRIGPGYILGTACQWLNGKLETIWPPLDGSYHGLRYEGVVEAKLPPWVVEYWKKKK